ncbi:CHY zinc finger protein [Alkalicoccobacillus murimartini]|uniref:CHY-type Zn-finger protein n=1 Tax=Alkalicoccobacillus murimartini TaxID=171685 RepID=A0ABT9YID0_9BACI|nr:CHY zinc finger protein [Alkalicoccobacillus murimartini]MDQ0207618.1 putative CHY-type Zn-finger protein [Alkalicoccobacillus murimartini]
MKKIKGSLLDEQTRCVHYHSEKDIIAIKFKCCGHYYPCYQCHQEHEDHPIKVWSKENYNEKAILCGVCQSELRIDDYLRGGYFCPNCGSLFNEGCKHHSSIYFEE